MQQDGGGNSIWFVKSVKHWMIGESGNRGRNLETDGIRSSVVTETILPHNVEKNWEYFTKGRVYGGQWITDGNRNEIHIMQGVYLYHYFSFWLLFTHTCIINSSFFLQMSTKKVPGWIFSELVKIITSLHHH